LVNRFRLFGFIALAAAIILSAVFSEDIVAAAAAVTEARTAFAPSLTITPITWGVVGLDSNQVTDGPNVFPVGARVCNTGDMAATNVQSAFVWDSANVLINPRTGSSG